MKRVERFRQSRRIRHRIAAAVILFLVLMLSGIAVADYSINCIMRNERRIEIFSIRQVDNNYLQISLMNKKLCIDTRFVKRDYKRLTELIKN